MYIVKLQIHEPLNVRKSQNWRNPRSAKSVGKMAPVAACGNGKGRPCDLFTLANQWTTDA